MSRTIRESSLPAWRRYSRGVEVSDDGHVHARVWAPRRTSVELVTYRGDSIDRAIALDRDDDGFFSGDVERVEPGSLYRFRLDGQAVVPDPTSRFQPAGPHGPSEIVQTD